ncbi:hypothetical protein F2Q68_00007796, partial [Brassica cretica]
DTAFENIKIHLSWISRLKLHLNSIKLTLEPVLGARIDHLASHLCYVRTPFGRPQHLNNKYMQIIRTER